MFFVCQIAHHGVTSLFWFKVREFATSTTIEFLEVSSIYSINNVIPWCPTPTKPVNIAGVDIIEQTGQSNHWDSNQDWLDKNITIYIYTVIYISYTSFFKVTFWFPKRRSRKPPKGHLWVQTRSHWRTWCMFIYIYRYDVDILQCSLIYQQTTLMSPLKVFHSLSQLHPESFTSLLLQVWNRHFWTRSMVAGFILNCHWKTQSFGHFPAPFHKDMCFPNPAYVPQKSHLFTGSFMAFAHPTFPPACSNATCWVLDITSALAFVSCYRHLSTLDKSATKWWWPLQMQSFLAKVGKDIYKVLVSKVYDTACGSLVCELWCELYIRYL